GLGQCDKFLYVNDDFIKAGTLLAIGIISSGIQDACDPASALLIDHIHSERAVIRVGSVLGLGLAYANSKRETVIKNEEGGVIFELKKVLTDSKPSATSEVKGLTGLALGLIMVGTADHTVAMEMLQTLMERNETELSDPNMRFLALGIALIFLGTQEKSEVFVESLRSLPEPFGPMVSTLVDVCAYAGTGNVLKIQKLLHMCSEHYETEDKKKKKDDKSKKDAAKTEKDKDAKPDLSSQQAVAVIGIGLIAMGEEVGSQMALRMFGHLIRYGEPVIRRAVPLALALISVSNPQLKHSGNLEQVGAGTNNARLVAMLRSLASYHHKDQISLMLVRLSQGLTHLGKGTMTLNPWHSDRQLLCPSAIAALLTICFAFLDANNSVLNNRQHYLL
ncbi:Proteasome/cyclosome repeat protein, partial [Ostertagia ostertagi]